MAFRLQWTNASGGKEITVDTAKDAVAKYEELNAGTILNLTVLDSTGKRVTYEALLKLRGS
jgi:hypothetical protein